MDPELSGHIEISEDTRTSLPIAIITGDHDDYREPCERARDIFSTAGHPVLYMVLPDTPHRYQSQCEMEVWDFLRQAVLPMHLGQLWVAAAALRLPGCDRHETHIDTVCCELCEEPSLVAELLTTGLAGKLVLRLQRVQVARLAATSACSSCCARAAACQFHVSSRCLRSAS